MEIGFYSAVPQTGQKWPFFACLDLLGCVSGGNYFPLSSSGANYSILAILVFWLHSMTFWGGVVAIPMPMPKMPNFVPQTGQTWEWGYIS